MFKATPNLKGCILQNIGTTSSIIEVDEESYAYISGIIGSTGDNLTYAKLGEVPLMEYVRIKRAINGFLEIDRAIDNTIALAFPASTGIEYILTATAVLDMISDTTGMAINVTLTGVPPVEVEQLGTNNFKISMPVSTFISSDNTVDITGTYPNFDINVVKGVNGCCS